MSVLRLPLEILTSLGLAFAAIGGALAAGADADEDARRFLAALRANHLDDVAVDYLDGLRDSRAASDQFKATIDYVAGMILIESSAHGASAADRDESLTLAAKRFERFLGEHGDHPLAAEARWQAADVLVRRAENKAAQAAEPNLPPDEQQKLGEEARGLLRQSQQRYASLERAAGEQLRKLPKIIARNDTHTQPQQQQLERELLEARLQQATLSYEIAGTYALQSAERKAALLASARQYAAVYDRYKTRVAGLYARLWEGRSRKELGEHRKALTIFEELLGQPDEPAEFRVLKNKAAVLALETALLPSVKQYREAVELFRAWRDSPRATEQSAEGLAIRFLAAEAALEAAKTMDPGDSQCRDYLALARENYQTVGKSPGAYKLQALARLREAVFEE